MFEIQSKSLGAVMKILGLPHNVAYGSLQKLHSVLRIPTFQDAAREPMTFYHASFADYLMDPVRSKQFHIDDIDDIAEEVVERLFKIMQKFVDVWPEATVTEEDFLPPPIWSRLKIVDTNQQAAKNQAISGLDYDLLQDARMGTYLAISGTLKTNHRLGPFVSWKHRNECFDFLDQIDFSRLYSLYFRERMGVPEFHELLFRLWEQFPGELQGRGLVEEIKLQDLTFDHLECQRTTPVHIVCFERLSDNSVCSLEFPPSMLHDYISALKAAQRHAPTNRVLICGSQRGKRGALFQYEFRGEEKHVEDVLWNLLRQKSYHCISQPG